MNKIPDISTWHKFKHRDRATLEGVEYSFISADYYSTDIDGVEWSCGVFSIDSTIILMAWGIKAEPHCSMHAVWDHDKWSEPQIGCPRHSLVSRGQKSALKLMVDKKALVFEPNS
jgi:hypothetical protein